MAETKTDSDKVRAALGMAIDRAEKRSVQLEVTGRFDPRSKVEMAIKKLRENRHLSREELDRPMTI